MKKMEVYLSNLIMLLGKPNQKTEQKRNVINFDPSKFIAEKKGKISEAYQILEIIGEGN